jgi:peroxiredoxin
MKKRMILLLIIGITVFLASVLWVEDKILWASSSSPYHFGIQRLLGEKESPPFSLKDLNGNLIALKDFRGKPILLTFWLSYCSACQEDLPLLEKFSEGKRDQLIMLTVGIDGKNEKRMRRFVKEKKITLPILLDSKEEVARAYGVRMVPTTFLINQDGLMVGMIVGQRD